LTLQIAHKLQERRESKKEKNWSQKQRLHHHYQLVNKKTLSIVKPEALAAYKKNIKSRGETERERERGADNCGLKPTLSPNNIKVIEMPKEESPQSEQDRQTERERERERERGGD